MAEARVGAGTGQLVHRFCQQSAGLGVFFFFFFGFGRLHRFGIGEQFLEFGLEGFANLVGHYGIGQLGIRHHLEDTVIGQPVGQILVHTLRHLQHVHCVYVSQVRTAQQRSGAG